MLLLCYFYQRNYFLLWVYSYYYFLFPIVAHNVFFVVEISQPEKQVFRGFNKFFQNRWIATQVININ